MCVSSLFIVWAVVKKWPDKTSVRDLRYLMTPIDFNDCDEKEPLTAESLVPGKIYFLAGHLVPKRNGRKRVLSAIRKHEYGAFVFIGNIPEEVDEETKNKYFLLHVAYRAEKKPQLETYWEDEFQQLRFFFIFFATIECAQC